MESYEGLTDTNDGVKKKLVNLPLFRLTSPTSTAGYLFIGNVADCKAPCIKVSTSCNMLLNLSWDLAVCSVLSRSMFLGSGRSSLGSSSRCLPTVAGRPWAAGRGSEKNENNAFVVRAIPWGQRGFELVEDALCRFRAWASLLSWLECWRSATRRASTDRSRSTASVKSTVLNGVRACRLCFFSQNSEVILTPKQFLTEIARNWCPRWWRCSCDAIISLASCRLSKVTSENFSGSWPREIDRLAKASAWHGDFQDSHSKHSKGLIVSKILSQRSHQKVARAHQNPGTKFSL